MKKVVIYMDGGVIQHVVCSEPTEIFVVDYDVEGLDVDHPHLTKLSGDDCLLFPVEPGINEHCTHLVAKTWRTL